MISRDEVQKIAGLARIKISQEEEKSLQKDLSSILDYVNTLNEVDVSMVDPQIHAALISSVVREDEIIERNLREEEEAAATIVKSSPDHDNGFIKVKAIL
mgnify:CR=1 FL=1